MNILPMNNMNCAFKSIQTKENEKKTVSKDVFTYINRNFKREYAEKMRDYLCPNSLNAINKKLRYAETAEKLEWYNLLNPLETDTIKAVDDAFDILPSLDEDRTFYRGLYGLDLPKNIRNAEVGEIIIPDKGYAQVALSSYYAEKYLPSEYYDPVLFEIKCPKGSKVSLSKHTGTGYEEGMLKRGAKFKILAKEKKNFPIINPSWDVPGAYNKEDRIAEKIVLEYLD